MTPRTAATFLVLWTLLSSTHAYAQDHPAAFDRYMLETRLAEHINAELVQQFSSTLHELAVVPDADLCRIDHDATSRHPVHTTWLDFGPHRWTRLDAAHDATSNDVWRAQEAFFDERGRYTHSRVLRAEGDRFTAVESTTRVEWYDEGMVLARVTSSSGFSTEYSIDPFHPNWLLYRFGSPPSPGLVNAPHITFAVNVATTNTSSAMADPDAPVCHGDFVEVTYDTHRLHESWAPEEFGWLRREDGWWIELDDSGHISRTAHETRERGTRMSYGCDWPEGAPGAHETWTLEDDAAGPPEAPPHPLDGCDWLSTAESCTLPRTTNSPPW